MAFIRNKNSAFSLIEILQTVVLIGIIAGLSISFFRSVNTDTKLRDSTEIMLYQAIQEANRQMCSDTTPICWFEAQAGQNNVQGSVVANGQCANGIYSNGLCIINNAANCPANTEEYINSENVRSCISQATCNVNGRQGIIVPANQALCISNPQENGRFEAQWNAQIQRTIDGTTFNTGNNQVHEICYRLWDLINHKPQNNSLANDLTATCVTAAANCFTINDGSDPECPAGVNSANMILPNGVRLHNLSGLGFTNNRTNPADGQHIYIKYDRNPLISTHNLNSTSEMFNAVMLGSSNNLECNQAFTNNSAGSINVNNNNFAIPSRLNWIEPNQYQCNFCINNFCAQPNNWVPTADRFRINGFMYLPNPAIRIQMNNAMNDVQKTCLTQQTTGVEVCGYCDGSGMICKFDNYVCHKNKGCGSIGKPYENMLNTPRNEFENKEEFLKIINYFQNEFAKKLEITNFRTY